MRISFESYEKSCHIDFIKVDLDSAFQIATSDESESAFSPSYSSY